MKSLSMALVMVLVASSARAQDEHGPVHDWVRSVVETSLDYHCRAKFGDTEKTFTANPDKLHEKWLQLDTILRDAEQVARSKSWTNPRTGHDLNAELIAYFRKLRHWELWLRSSKEDFHRKMDYFLVRTALESLGGEDVQRIYDLMPDDAEANQDLGSIVNAGINRELENGHLQLVLETTRLNLIDDLTGLNDPAATAIASELTRLTDRVEFEREWLEEYRPGWLVQDLVQARKELYTIKQSIASRVTKEKLERIEACPGILCRQFMADYLLADRYEQKGMPRLAIDPATRYRDLLDAAYKESLDWSAAASPDASPLPAQLMEHLLTTNRVYEPRSSSDGEPFDYVNPVDIKTIQAQAEAIRNSGEAFGFVGMIDAPEKVVALDVVGDDMLVVMGRSGLATYDLGTGKIGHLMYDLRPDIELTALAVTGNGSHAFVVTDDPAILRYDLQTGQQDKAFGPLEVDRKDARIAVAPDGKTLAVGMFGKVYLHNGKTGELINQFRSQLNLQIYGLSFTSRGRTLLVNGNGPMNYEYVLPSGEKKRERRLVPDKRNAYTYYLGSANGMLAGAGVGAVAAWKEGSDDPVFQADISGPRVDVRARWASVTPDGRHVISSHGIWDIESGRVVVRFVPRWTTEAMAMTADGGRLAIGFDDTLFVVPTCLARASHDGSAVVEADRGGQSDSETDPEVDTESMASEPESEPELELRTWTDSTGKFQIEATLAEVTAEAVVLRRADGSEVTVPLDRLSRGDRRYLDGLDK